MEDAEARAAMMQQLGEQVQAKLAEQVASFIAGLPEPVQERVGALQTLQKQHDALVEEYQKEREELEKKFAEKYAPLYKERADIVTGTSGPAADKEPKGIPGFWLNALSNVPPIMSMITEKDAEVLQFLTDISTSRLADGEKGFKLTFTFAENPFFSNKTLEKSYHMIAEGEEPVLERIEGAEIQWATGKNVTVKVMKKKPKKAGGKPLMKSEPCESFFNFFSPPEVPEDEDDLSPEEAEELQNEMEDDYDLGALLRDRVIPNALNWFTGEAALLEDFEDYEDDEDDDEDEDGDEDGEGDDDDEVDSSDEEGGAPAAKPKRGAVPKPAAGKEGEQPPECKQQ